MNKILPIILVVVLSGCSSCDTDLSNNQWHNCEGTKTVKGHYTYEGEFKHGEPSGDGIREWASGSRYEGEFKQGRRHGEGLLTSKGITYEGEYVRGKKTGKGILTIEIDDGRGRIIYEGGFLDGLQYGQGKKLWYNEDGDVFLEESGQWKDGYLNGECKKIMPSNTFYELYGVFYKGECKKGKYHGQGTFVNKHMVYQGQWKDGDREGFGTEKNKANGDIYIGEFKKGKAHGKGKKIFNDDTGEIISKYKNGKRYGKYTHIFRVKDLQLTTVYQTPSDIFKSKNKILYFFTENEDYLKSAPMMCSAMYFITTGAMDNFDSSIHNYAQKKHNNTKYALQERLNSLKASPWTEEIQKKITKLESSISSTNTKTNQERSSDYHKSIAIEALQTLGRVYELMYVAGMMQESKNLLTNKDVAKAKDGHLMYLGALYDTNPDKVYNLEMNCNEWRKKFKNVFETYTHNDESDSFLLKIKKEVLPKINFHDKIIFTESNPRWEKSKSMVDNSFKSWDKIDRATPYQISQEALRKIK